MAVRYDLIYYIFQQFIWPNSTVGHGVMQLVKALRYKPEGSSSFPDGLIGTFH